MIKHGEGFIEWQTKNSKVIITNTRKNIINSNLLQLQQSESVNSICRNKELEFSALFYLFNRQAFPYSVMSMEKVNLLLRFLKYLTQMS